MEREATALVWFVKDTLGAAGSPILQILGQQPLSMKPKDLTAEFESVCYGPRRTCAPSASNSSTTVVL